MVLTPASPEDVRECAAMWFARMRRPDAAAFEKEFEAWLAISAEHRAAYNRMAETFSLGKNLTSNLGLNNPVAEPQRPQHQLAHDQKRPALADKVERVSRAAGVVIRAPGQ